MWRFDPSAAKAGDAIFISERWGWNSRRVARWIVERITPGGQVVCKRNDAELRINSRGRIVGDTNYSRAIVSESEAASIRADSLREAAWLKVRGAAEALNKAARNKDAKAAKVALAEAASGIEAATADETPQEVRPEGREPDPPTAGDARPPPPSNPEIPNG